MLHCGKKRSNFWGAAKSFATAKLLAPRKWERFSVLDPRQSEHSGFHCFYDDVPSPSEQPAAVVRRRLFGRAGEPVLDLAPPFNWCVFRVWSTHVVRKPWPIVSLSTKHVMRNVHVAQFDQRSVGISDRSVGDLRLTGRKFWNGARCSQSVRKPLFPFARTRAKCRQNGPSMQVHGGICVRVTPKVLRVRSSFGRAGEPTMALKKWVGRTDRARNKAPWTHWGPVLMHKCISHVRPSSDSWWKPLRMELTRVD